MAQEYIRTPMFLKNGKMIEVRAIVATDKYGIIGYDNDLIFDNDVDLEYFKAKTTNTVVVMGRKTYESIGSILGRRQSIVITHDVEAVNGQVQKDYKAWTKKKKAEGKKELVAATPAPIVTDDPASVIPDACESFGTVKLWVIGGVSIYTMFYPITRSWLVTDYAIDLVKEGEERSLLPEDFDPTKLAVLDKDLYGRIGRTRLEFGEWEGIKFNVWAYTVTGRLKASTPKDKKIQADELSQRISEEYTLAVSTAEPRLNINQNQDDFDVR